MYIKEIKDMINLMNENGLSELEIESDGLRIKLRKGASGIQEKIEHISGHHAAAVQEKPKAAEALEKANTVEIKAPMVGTFYKTPSPEMPPYVNVGDVVEPGQVICIIEAMKLMNEIKSDIKGRIVSIAVDNAEPVEFGQTLFILEPVQ